MRDSNGYGLPTPQLDTHPHEGIGNVPDPNNITPNG